MGTLFTLLSCLPCQYLFPIFRKVIEPFYSLLSLLLFLWVSTLLPLFHGPREEEISLWGQCAMVYWSLMSISKEHLNYASGGSRRSSPGRFLNDGLLEGIWNNLPMDKVFRLFQKRQWSSIALNVQAQDLEVYTLHLIYTSSQVSYSVAAYLLGKFNFSGPPFFICQIQRTIGPTS